MGRVVPDFCDSPEGFENNGDASKSSNIGQQCGIKVLRASLGTPTEPGQLPKDMITLYFRLFVSFST